MIYLARTGQGALWRAACAACRRSVTVGALADMTELGAQVLLSSWGWGRRGRHVVCPPCAGGKEGGDVA